MIAKVSLIAGMLLIAAPALTKEMGEADKIGQAGQSSPAFNGERAAAAIVDAPDAQATPAWQQQGYVMDVVVATATPMTLELPEAKPVKPDLEDLLQLHREARSLKF